MAEDNQLYQGVMSSILKLSALQKNSRWNYPELKRIKRKFDECVDELDEVKRDFDKLLDHNAEKGIDKSY